MKLECQICTYISVEGKVCPCLYEDGSHKTCHICGAPLHPVRGCHKQWYHDRDAYLDGKPNYMETFRKEEWDKLTIDEKATKSTQYNYNIDKKDPSLPIERGIPTGPEAIDNHLTDAVIKKSKPNK